MNKAIGWKKGHNYLILMNITQVKMNKVIGWKKSQTKRIIMNKNKMIGKPVERLQFKTHKKSLTATQVIMKKIDP